MADQNEVTIIIPAYNEEASIGQVVENIKEQMKRIDVRYELIVVDDGSKDKTAEIAKAHHCRVIKQNRNLGYGASLKTGILNARYEQIVITDADGTYPPENIPEIVEKLQNADMVVGARISQNVNIPLIRRFPKWILKKLAGYITGETIPDLNSGLRAFRKQFVLQYFSILPDKFSFTTTITVASLCDHYKVIYIPIDYHKRFGKSKIVPWDFVNFFNLVLRLSMLFNPLKVFIPVSFTFLFFGAGKFIMDIVVAFLRANEVSFSILTQQGVISTTALILLLSGLQILLIGMMSDGLGRKIEQRMPTEYKSHAFEEWED